MNFDGLRAGGVELIFKKLPISRVWGSPGPNSRARGHGHPVLGVSLDAHEALRVEEEQEAACETEQL